MGKVLLALKGAGIAEKDYQTSRLSLQPQYGQNKSTGASPVVGFRASNRVTVKIRDVTKVAGIIDTLVGAGANDIGNISFEVTQASKLLDDAREQAVVDARRKAEIYAKATGVTLGSPLSISEGGAPVPLFRGRDGDSADGGARASRPGRRNAVGDGECHLGDHSPEAISLFRTRCSVKRAAQSRSRPTARAAAWAPARSAPSKRRCAGPG